MPTFATPSPIAVTIELGVGNVTIDASDRADTVVEVRPTNPDSKGDVTAAGAVRVDFSNGLLLVKATKGAKRFTPWGGKESVDVRIALPTGSSVRGDTGLAPLRTSGRLGECTYKTGMSDLIIAEAGPLHLRSGMGDITVEHAHERVEASTGTGQVRLGIVEGSAVVKNSYGDTVVDDVTGELTVSAASGKVTVGKANGSVTAKTAYGDVRFDEVSGGTINGQTAFGKVEVGVRDGVAAWLDLQTSHGVVRNELSDASGPAAGAPTVHVKAHTAFGDITIRRCVTAGSGRGVA